MYTAIRTEDKLQTQLATILGSSLRNELGKRTFATLLSPERGAVMDNIQVALNREALKYGAEIIDVRIKRRSEEHTSELQSLMRISYAVFCLKKKKKKKDQSVHHTLNYQKKRNKAKQ